MFDWRHAQCNNCGKMTRGPHEDEVFNDRRDTAGNLVPVYAADDEGVYYEDEAKERGLGHNVSGTLCPDCYQSTLTRYRAHKAAGAAVSEGYRKHEIRRLQQRTMTARRRYNRTGALTDLQDYQALQQRLRDDYGAS